MEPACVSSASSRDERPLPPIPAPELGSISVADVPANNSFSLSTSQEYEGHVEESLGRESSVRGKSVLKVRASQASTAANSSTGVSTLLDRGAQTAVQMSDDGYRDNSRIGAFRSSDTASSERGSPSVHQAKDSNDTVSSSAGALVIALAQGLESVSRVFQGSPASGSDPPGATRLLSHTLSPSRIGQQYNGDMHSLDQARFVIPRWQPDAEVTICPICRTQFSFFPSSEATSPTTISRLTLEYGGAGTSTSVENLGGGERVRLCNPCVPDPNTAPPQVAENRRRLSQQGRGRSVSETVTSNHSRNSTQTPANLSAIYTRQQRQRQPSNLSPSNPTTSSYSESSNSLMRPEDLHIRSRSSTVGTNHALGHPTSSSAHSGPMNRHHPESRAPLREEDECWVCHRELPSSSLHESERLRQEHVLKCISDAERGSSTTRPALPSTSESRSPRGDRFGQAESSLASPLARSVPTPTASTPEARIAAREDALASVVQAAESSVTPTRRVGLVSYKASEKDCVDDAECTICLEEFEVGELMGRLECFCRFHYKCIQQWFVGHPGQCPVHQHGAGY
ncbi:hypothetical protein B2J93_7788 [Marssonina coronariae]|uniref:RING-type E3 ubiquitin transferase n=1 Tax=Diplocarpon coronariae TaxID=2795749 RepID=A0A218ZH13_9HELO|nr:hypothetical protein B2J93_7788 [Marssonina coronariae]